MVKDERERERERANRRRREKDDIIGGRIGPYGRRELDPGRSSRRNEHDLQVKERREEGPSSFWEAR